MKYLLIANTYPNEERIYSNTFLHGRVKSYQKHNLDIEVVVFTTKVLMDEVYDGVTIKYMDELQLKNYIEQNQFKAILFHFINKKMMSSIDGIKNLPRIIIWFHGFEAEAWYARYYNFLSSSQALQNQLEKRNTFYEDQFSLIKSLYHREDLDIHFVFVSRKFKELYVDPFIGKSPENFKIIPNLIDEDIFIFHEKHSDLRFKICNIRPYTAKNYANDITRDVILKLSRKKYFKQLQFNLYGEGPLFEEITTPLKKFSNVKLHRGYVRQVDIPDIHAEHGIYLGPTRHDSQGVSLCEAMSSGLVPITNNIGAIDEFITHGHSGFLAERDNVKEMVDYIDCLIRNKDLFLSMSKNAHSEIKMKTNKSLIVKKEIEVITGGK